MLKYYYFLIFFNLWFNQVNSKGIYFDDKCCLPAKVLVFEFYKVKISNILLKNNSSYETTEKIVSLKNLAYTTNLLTSTISNDSIISDKRCCSKSVI